MQQNGYNPSCTVLSFRDGTEQITSPTCSTRVIVQLYRTEPTKYRSQHNVPYSITRSTIRSTYVCTYRLNGSLVRYHTQLAVPYLHVALVPYCTQNVKTAGKFVSLQLRTLANLLLCSLKTRTYVRTYVWESPEELCVNGLL